MEQGVAALTTGHLPPQLFPPAQLRQVLDSVSDKLSRGWSFSTYRGRGDTLWNTYRDAEVTTGIVGLQLQVYVSIPTYEIATKFTLYEVINLPEVAKEVFQEGEAISTRSSFGIIHLLSRNDSFIKMAKEVLERTMQYLPSKKPVHQSGNCYIGSTTSFGRRRLSTLPMGMGPSSRTRDRDSRFPVVETKTTFDLSRHCWRPHGCP